MPEQFKFNNYLRKLGNRDWFEWMVFVDETDEKINKIDSIEYRLHPSFPNPIRIINERGDPPFALRTFGFGSFMIFITIHLKGGGETNTRYYLDLSKEKPWPPNVI